MADAKDRSAAISATAPRRVVFVVYPGANPLDVAGPSTAFAFANDAVPGAYELHHASSTGGEITTETGLCFSSLTPLQDLPTPIDTVLLAGGPERALRQAGADELLSGWLADRAGDARRLGSVCTGAFLLAAAGLLDGRRAVTHWGACEVLRAMFPKVEVVSDAMYVRERGRFSSAGICAGIDLSLALIEDDLGASVAAEVARAMVVYLRRSGGQPQLSAVLAAQARARGSFTDLVVWISDNLAEDLSVSTLARQVHMSERNFQRRFRQRFNQTPAAFVKAMRLEAARRWLETTDVPVKTIAHEAGFGSVDALERAIKKDCGATPAALRAKR